MTRILLLLFGTLLIARFSWPALRDPAVHGFYRFFVFEGILALTLANGLWGESHAPFWLERVAQMLLVVALLLAAIGFHTLRLLGGQRNDQRPASNKAFENTATLVTTGIYRHIRHPMYSALLLWGWGLYLDDPHWLSTLLILFTTLFTLLAAQVEERENLAFFGEPYRHYMARSRRFLPFIL